jgi:SAM-dependent methyltransferase
LTRSLLDFLVCPKCGGRLSNTFEMNGPVTCIQCNQLYPVNSGIPQLFLGDVVDTKLDIETYKRLAFATPKAVANVYDQHQEILASLGYSFKGDALEIGAGTGLLTEALLRHSSLDYIISTDVSYAFASYTRDRLLEFESKLDLAVCDGNTLPFKVDAFDMVFGRSVLHHLLHYRQALSKVLNLLKPRGIAIFFEPVADGKALIAFMFKIILGMEEMTKAIGLTDEEKLRLTRGITGMTKAICLPQDEVSLSKLEDKYNFDPDKLCSEACDLGFKRAWHANIPNADLSYFPYLSMHLRNYGVRPEIVQKLSWMRAAFQETIGGVAGKKLRTPMGYFVFEK